MIYKYISQLANSQRRLIDRLAKGKGYSGTEGKIIHFLFENKTMLNKIVEYKQYYLRNDFCREWRQSKAC